MGNGWGNQDLGLRLRLSKGEGLELGLPRYRKPRDSGNVILRFKETQTLGNNSSHQCKVMETSPYLILGTKVI